MQGAILTAGSDAPVDTRDPRPFINMSHALTRHGGMAPALNPKQAITIRDVIDAYTINGARMLGLGQGNRFHRGGQVRGFHRSGPGHRQARRRQTG